MARWGSKSDKRAALALVGFEAEIGQDRFFGDLHLHGVSAGGSASDARSVLSPAQCRMLADELSKLTAPLGE